MTAPAKTAPATPQPLERLEQLLHDEMMQVNALILQRFQSDIALIPQVAAYLIAAGGKRIRPLLTLSAAAMADGDIVPARGFAAAVEFIHTATLLHDDVVDGSEKRRGKDAANIVFGNQASVLVGDFLFSKSFELMVEGNNLRALDRLARASAIIAEGEVLQMSLRGDLGMRREQYLKIIECKTAALFRAATESGAIITGQDETAVRALYDYGHNLGMCFQIADDMIDYASTAGQMGKNSGDDFREGKITLPVLIAIERADNEGERAFWGRVMSDKAQEDGDFERALALIHKYDAMDEARSLCDDYARKAEESLTRLTPKSGFAQDVRAAMHDMVGFVVRRDR